MNKLYNLDNYNKKTVLEYIESWINSESLQNIILAFGGNIPKLKTRELVDWMVEFSDIWDFRNNNDYNDKEKPRWLISKTLDENIEGIVLKEAKELGLVKSSIPKLKKYDYVVALGGARLSNLERVKFLKKVICDNKIEVQNVVGLSSMREILDSERKYVDTYSKDAKTEYDLMNSSIEKVFGVKEFLEDKYIDNNPNFSYAKREYGLKAKDKFKLLSLAGPSTDKLRRANSADTFKYLFKELNIIRNSRILLVTTQIYVPYQQMEAIRTICIPKDVYVETIGYGGNFKGPQLLQEIRSALQSMKRYLDSIY